MTFSKSPLRTRILESGSSTDPESWIRGRQYTGRVVSLSNRFVFCTPVYNSSMVLDHLWEELTLPIPYEADWHLAERILCEEAQNVSSTAEARSAIDAMRHRYPTAEAEVDPRVFVRATSNWIELSARFVVPVRGARQVRTRSPGGCWVASPKAASGWRRRPRTSPSTHPTR
ncbi:hypothetical protein NKG94_51035 [Micromonospora sp. M12]